ncbi:MAG: hypothetical protein HDS48_01840 [Bacteroides sp.]|nr:hypothetical protein [Bacteroides sp.]
MMNKEIQKGDRIFARLTMGGKPILEFMINSVASMEQLLCELRSMTVNLRGLCRLQVRNQTRGWMNVSNLMFYGDHNTQGSGCNLFNVEPALVRRSSNSSKVASAKRIPADAGGMLFPWDTH